MQRIGILGSGAWGTALAYTALSAGREVRLWAREPEVAEALSAGKGNPVYLPDIELPAMPAPAVRSAPQRGERPGEGGRACEQGAGGGGAALANRRRSGPNR